MSMHSQKNLIRHTAAKVCIIFIFIVGKVAGLGRFVDQQCIDTNPVNGNVTTLRTKSALRRTGLGQDKVFNIQASKAAVSSSYYQREWCT